MKKVLKIVLFTLICLILLIGISGYIVLNHVDLNKYKGTIENIVEENTGRKLEIGNIHIKASIKPTIEIDDVSLANAAWSKEPYMATIGAINIRVGLLALLKGQYVINRFIISDAVVNLEENAENGANWVFEKPIEEVEVQDPQISYNFSLIKQAYAEEIAEEEVSSSTDVSDILSKIVIKEVALSNVKINYTDKTAQKQSYDIKNLTLDERDDKNIDFNFNVNDGLYSGQGMVGALSKFKSVDGYPVQADVEVMGIKLSVDTLLFDVFGDLGFDGHVIAKGFMGKGSTYNESADVNVKGNLNNIDAIINSVALAGNVVTGDVNVKLDEKIPAITANLKSDKIDIASFAQKPQTAWKVSLIKEAYATTMVPNDKIPFEVLSTIRADANMAIAKVVNGSATVAENLKINAKVQDGKGILKILDGKVANGTIKADAALSAKGQTLTLKADMIKVNLKELMTALNAQSDTFSFKNGGDTDLYIDLSGRGATYAAIAESLNGRLALIVDKSELHLGNIGMIKGNVISQLLNTLKLTKGNDDLALTCAVVRADFKDGKAIFPNGVVVNADKFTIVANGDINLKNDKIDLGVKPFGGKLTDTNIAKALSSLVKLTGTLQKPSVGVDTANVAKNVIGATLTGPVYLGAQMAMENDNSPCYTALKDTGYENRFPKSTNLMKSTSDGAGKAIDSSVGMVKDTAKGLLKMFSGKSNDEE